jgi:anti-anti-sigma factor
MYHLTRFFFPFLSWMRAYRRSALKADALAGFTVALVLVPQSMANAQLAGLPAWHGLYAAVLPCIVGGIWGSSRQMVTGIGAVICILASTALQYFPIESPQDYIAYMALLTFLVGVFQLLFGALRLGMVVNFLSLPVLTGFTNAAAIIIAASQVGKLFGVQVESSGSSLFTFLDTLSAAWNNAHLSSILMAGAALLVLLLCPRVSRRLPPVLTAVVVCTLLSWAVDFEKRQYVPLDRIRSPEVVNLLKELNADMDTVRGMTRSVAALEGELSTKQRDAEAELTLNFLIQEKGLYLEKAAREASIARNRLRRMTFIAVEGKDGGKDFYLATQTPPPGKGDGLTWRILPGRGSVDLSALRLSAGGEVVGAIPAGLPELHMPGFSWSAIFILLPKALIISLVCFAESIAIAKNAARMRNYRIDANQELVGQGLANIAGAFSLTSPVSGSFSSSAVNLAARARTGMSCVFAGLAALVSLLFFTPALYYLPQPVLAVIVMRAVVGLLHLEQVRRQWIARWQDGVIAIITFACTLGFAPHLDYGIAVGVVLSMAWYFYLSMNPRIAILSNGPDNTLRDAKVFQLEECRHIAIVHFQGPLFFGNCGMLEEYILKRLETDNEVRHIHLVCTGITSIDASGEDTLATLVEQSHAHRVEMSFSGVVGSVADVLERTGVLHMVGLENLFLTPREAICAVFSRIQHEIECEGCPLADLFCRQRETAAGYRSYHGPGDEKDCSGA